MPVTYRLMGQTELTDANEENKRIAIWCAGFETARNDIAMILARNTSELAKLAQVRAWLEDS